MKILWFTNSPAAAYEEKHVGTGGWLFSLDQAIQEKVELHVAYHYPYKQNSFQRGSTWYHPIFTGNILIENIKRRFMPKYHKSLVNVYLQIIKTVKPDLIHIHGSENNFHSVAGKTDIPIVLSVQGNPTVIAYKYDVGFKGKYVNVSLEHFNFKTLLLGSSNYRSVLNDLKLMSNMEVMDLPKINNFIGRTDWDRRITSVLSPHSKYYMVNETLRPLFYNNAWQMETPKDKLVIHTTTSNGYFKGFETVCHALQILNQYGIDVEWRVAGISESSSINRIAKKHLGKNYPQRGLVLMGSLNEDALIDSMLTSHIYVMPSHIENSPNSLCEAMILGMPCITTLAGGSDSILINKKEGLVIQDGDPWSMAGAILELKNNWSQALCYGRAAREHAVQRHNKESIVESLIKTYQVIIDNK